MGQRSLVSTTSSVASSMLWENSACFFDVSTATSYRESSEEVV